MFCDTIIYNNIIYNNYKNWAIQVLNNNSIEWESNPTTTIQPQSINQEFNTTTTRLSNQVEWKESLEVSRGSGDLIISVTPAYRFSVMSVTLSVKSYQNTVTTWIHLSKPIKTGNDQLNNKVIELESNPTNQTRVQHNNYKNLSWSSRVEELEVSRGVGNPNYKCDTSVSV